MAFIRLLIMVSGLVWAGGCTTVTVRPVNTALEIKHICIEDGQQMCFDGRMMDVIRDGLARHGIVTEIYTGNPPSECQYHLNYYCERTWDLATYLHHAELRLYRGREQIGFAEYHLNARGGLSPMKWQSTRTKMDPVIDQLLGRSPTQSQTPDAEGEGK